MSSLPQQVQAPKPVHFSRTTITELMIPSYANFGGKIHGGILLSLMDKVAYVCAAKHAGNYCVTASIDTVNFLEPVEVGELVSLMASVNYVGKTSLVVGIRVISENVKTNIVKHTNTSYFTMVAKNEHNEPVEVPALILENHDQIRRFEEGRQRKLEKINHAHKNKQIKANFNIDYCKENLAGERCVIVLEEQ